MRTFILASLCLMTGCVSARLKTYERTTTAPDGTVTKEKGREATYTDSREAAKGAQEFVSMATGGLGSILSSIGVEGALIGGGGTLTLFGVVGRLLMKNARAKGRDEGWEAREAAATVQQELPAKGSQT